MKLRCSLNKRECDWLEAEPKKPIHVRAEFEGKFVDTVRKLHKNGRKFTLTQKHRQTLEVEPGDEVDIWVSHTQQEQQDNTESQLNDTTPTEDKLDGSEFDFAVLPAGDVEHLVGENRSKTLCNLDLQNRDYTQSSDPSDHYDTCNRCNKRAQTGEVEQAELRRWLADEIEGVDERAKYPATFRKPETKALVDHIKEISDS